MIALWILLGILLLILLVLLIPVEVFAVYREEMTLTLKILFWKKTLLPSPPKHEKKQKKKPDKKPKKKKKDKEKPSDAEDKQPAKKQSLLGKIKEKKGLSGLISLLVEVAEIACGTLKWLFSHIVIHRMNIGVALNAGDAASTAVDYGKLCSVVYPAVNIITAVTVCRDYHVTVEPVFDSDKKTESYADVHAHLRPVFVVWEALKAGVKLLFVRLKM